MSRKRYLVSYDIADDKRRNKVFKVLGSHGMHTQYSVFLCELNPKELVDLKAKLTRQIHSQADQILMIDLGGVERDTEDFIFSLGYGFQPPARTRII